ncbi:kinase suppressor of Ras 2-like [Liolophura sinensis]|uniref:kinase suppressor of Ras 2-like n=1 Tax=Liolophura sinensis TaxID=3198878 RepID=UPI00315920AA
MLHAINHRFTHTFKITTCDYCHKQMFLGFKCKECKFKCHRDCASKAAPSCSLPNEYVQVFINSLKEGSPNAGRRVDNPNLIFSASTLDSSGLRPVFQIPDSSSNTSSCNSSTPSSPAPGLPASASITSPSPGPSPQIQFKFPEIDYGSPAEAATDGFVEYRSPTDDDIVNTNTSNDSDKTLIDSNTSEKTLPDRVDSLDSQDDPFGHNWNRQNSLSVTLKEWDIPFGDLVLGDDIGTGRFGTVYRGQWHGDVAIKMLKMDPDKDNQAQMSAFKLEVAMLRKTRHDNLVLFMGACMKPPHLAIVTSLCKGKTLYTHIHSLKEKFPMNKTVIIASQIAQGMGYLHARGIVHKDLKTKNIFLERDRVIITDFGLFNVTKLCGASRKGNWLSIPPGWLCYLSPEIICSLQAGSHFHCNSDLPFSEQSDVYAFGTVWYELLTGEWPFKKMPAETIIWQVGRGLKQSLSNVQASRDVKDVLMICWTYKPSDRPDFSRLLKALERLPKKRLLRSPSHPVHLSRSAESVI